MKDRCAQVGPRGGWCRRSAQVVNGWPLDFCAAHNQMVLDGHILQCRKCGTTTGAPAVGSIQRGVLYNVEHV